MTKNDEILIRKRTGNIFTPDQVPSIYSLVRKYMFYQNDTFGRNLNFRKALDEFLIYIFRPLRSEIRQENGNQERFYPVFFNKAYHLMHRDSEAEKKVSTNDL